jgi:hypothetical protein
MKDILAHIEEYAENLDDLKIDYKKFNTSHWISRDNNAVLKFSYEVLRWCEQILGSEGVPVFIEIFPNKNYRKLHGEYEAHTVTMYIYVKGHRTWKNLANTIIHEYVHHLQHPTWYTRYNQLYSYKNHPYEIFANKIADKTQNHATLYALKKIKRNLNG